MTNNDKSRVLIFNKKLIVEGEQDKRVIPELMEANGITWKKGKEPVDIQPHGGDGFINPYMISTRLKETGLTHLGLILDADEDAAERWQSIRNACSQIESIPPLPEQIPETGLIIKTLDDKKFGIWMMPDNQNRGMLETFLAYMIKDESEPLWQYTQEVVIEAKNRGAKFIDEHIDKARIHSWLAWQNPPGTQLHDAVKFKILDPEHPKAQAFVKWFKDLYDL
jgi:hypothetical protein